MDASTSEALIETFRSVFFDLEGKPDADVKNYRRETSDTWDSANHLLLVTCLEERFNIRVSDEEAATLDSFAYAAALLV